MARNCPVSKDDRSGGQPPVGDGVPLAPEHGAGAVRGRESRLIEGRALAAVLPLLRRPVPARDRDELPVPSATWSSSSSRPAGRPRQRHRGPPRLDQRGSPHARSSQGDQPASQATAERAQPRPDHRLRGVAGRGDQRRRRAGALRRRQARPRPVAAQAAGPLGAGEPGIDHRRPPDRAGPGGGPTSGSTDRRRGRAGVAGRPSASSAKPPTGSPLTPTAIRTVPPMRPGPPGTPWPRPPPAWKATPAGRCPTPPRPSTGPAGRATGGFRSASTPGPRCARPPG